MLNLSIYELHKATVDIRLRPRSGAPPGESRSVYAASLQCQIRAASIESLSLHVCPTCIIGPNMDKYDVIPKKEVHYVSKCR